MSRQVSPFAALTGVEKQMKWLEYQSIRLPYVEVNMDDFPAPGIAASAPNEPPKEAPKSESTSERPVVAEAEAQRPRPPEVPRVMPYDQKPRHSQYDAVIARMKQASLQSQRFQSLQITQQGH